GAGVIAQFADRIIGWFGAYNVLWPVSDLLFKSAIENGVNPYASPVYWPTALVNIGNYLILAVIAIIIIVKAGKKSGANFTLIFGIIISAAILVEEVFNIIQIIRMMAANVSFPPYIIVDNIIGIVFSLICPLLIIIGGILNKKAPKIKRVPGTPVYNAVPNSGAPSGSVKR
ncbi:MAG: hypothetical protein LBN36_08745, partial [Clostridiales Family XIII bacterium]|nr:hypothetical protein [Clostridiales Family XIII bacterium]